MTTMLDAGVSLRDVQIAARHADPKPTMRYLSSLVVRDQARDARGEPQAWLADA
ncbi:MAG: hypothetical protein QOE61_5896 [Micromonosporaceae bacterium]|jgi:hypothetical protein|nr:hypothetical protein [Micromonosporaceae bacterium]